MDKIVVDDLGQFRAGKFGALRPHIEQGLLSEAGVHAELAEIVIGRKPGRESEQEKILFWHRGLSLSDIALGSAMLNKALSLGVGQTLPYS
jgi:alanine dehydrogenase